MRTQFRLLPGIDKETVGISPAAISLRTWSSLTCSNSATLLIVKN